MASIIKDPGGRKRLQFVGTDGRRTIHLGKLEQRQADAIRVKVEALLAAVHAGIAPDADTARWLGTLNPKLHAKLAKAGLVADRGLASPTLGKLLDTFFATVSVKPGTLTTYEQSRRSLLEVFPAATPLKTITALAADRWRQGLKDDGLAEATISKRVKVARQIFKQGLRWKLLTENPFSEVKAGTQTNRSRMHFISRATINQVLDAAPDIEWKVIIALSRFGGMRCPSEHLALRWQDIDWEKNLITVWSCKTEGYEGREFRHLPLFPELRAVLEEARARADRDAEYIITRYRQPSCNLRTQMLRILAKAGVAPWPKLFHNLRSSRQTELTDKYPAHVVCAWLGNSLAVANNHYLQVRDAHFAAAVAETPAKKAAQIPTLHAAESPGTASQANLGQVA